jgi:hypothetical protein
VLVSIVLVIVGLGADLKAHSFIDHHIQKYQNSSQIISMSLMYVGLFYMTASSYPKLLDEESPIHYILFAFITLPSVWFVYVQITDVVMNILIIVYKKNIKVFRLITLNSFDQKKFYQKHICEDNDDSNENIDINIGTGNFDAKNVTHEDLEYMMTNT